MRSVLGLGFIVAAASSLGVLLLLGACNALTGASNLSTCEGCTDPGSPDRIDGSSGDAEGVPVPDAGPQLPATCTGTEVACAGKVAAQCVGDQWQKTTCSELCIAGKCESWPSCRNAAGAGCGSSGATTSCCASASVPGGTFNRRNSPIGTKATVSPFDLDTYEVTVGRMRAFVEAGGVTQATPPAAGAGAHPKIPSSGWQSVWNIFLPASVASLRTSFAKSNATWTDTPAANEHLPINNVSWFIAFAFCAWDGARLPTYAEWNFAAAGGSDQRTYPWSTSPTDTSITSARAAYECRFTPPAKSCPSSHCSDNSSTPCDTATCLTPLSCVYPPCTGCTFADIAPVGSLPTGAGRWGHFELAGNVGELVLDDDGLLPLPCTDCARLPPTQLRGAGNQRLDANFVVAGGGWGDTPSAVRTSSITTLRDGQVDDGTGFRCAR